jgi:hypothetical protein
MCHDRIEGTLKMRLDAMEPIDLADEQVRECANAIGAVRRLASGLDYLYAKVNAAEMAISRAQEEAHGTDVAVFEFGNSPLFSNIRLDLVDCAFQWYAVSACNMVQAVASFAFGSDRSKRESYKQRVLGPLVAYRDKIAAHFAGMTGNKHDNDAERVASLILPVGWSRDGLRSPTFRVALTAGGTTSNSAALADWRLTDFHESLRDRYPLMTASAASGPQV